MEAQSDLEEIVIKAKQGDQAAFSSLYKEYSPQVFGYLQTLLFKFRLNNPRDHAEDLTQKTFILAYQKISDLKDESKFINWVYRIARNEAYQLMRRERKINQELNLDDLGKDSLYLRDTRAIPGDKIRIDEYSKLLNRSLNRVHRNYRPILIDRIINNLSIAEISRSRKMNPNTLRANLARGKKNLIVNYEEEVLSNGTDFPSIERYIRFRVRKDINSQSGPSQSI
nr:RNA polymerase sigma factor [Candidatus Woesearchaeota archaeon]